jgi:hypothetical protein
MLATEGAQGELGGQQSAIPSNAGRWTTAALAAAPKAPNMSARRVARVLLHTVAIPDLPDRLWLGPPLVLEHQGGLRTVIT